jgi:type IV secretory pathway TraG/TraD family ATPase VirD4
MRGPDRVYTSQAAQVQRLNLTTSTTQLATLLTPTVLSNRAFVPKAEHQLFTLTIGVLVSVKQKGTSKNKLDELNS